jgi:hypothetical protein
LLGNVTGAEKKARKKAKKAAHRSQEESKKGLFSEFCLFQCINEVNCGLGLSNDDKGLELAPVKDDDPDGLKLISVPDPLERAAKFLSPLATLASNNIEVWIMIYDVAVRRSESYPQLSGC